MSLFPDTICMTKDPIIEIKISTACCNMNKVEKSREILLFTKVLNAILTENTITKIEISFMFSGMILVTITGNLSTYSQCGMETENK